MLPVGADSDKRGVPIEVLPEPLAGEAFKRQ
jgi:hypothetical protein